ncbi:hypothetical protein [Natronospira sp.]|uniref:hypothetical protein n=1 Tax=Natronospira sp. TaxID=2024970 RepID=UPI003873570C
MLSQKTATGHDQDIDHRPDRRNQQLEAARRILRSPSSDKRLQHACEVLLALSADPLDRLLAKRMSQPSHDQPAPPGGPVGTLTHPSRSPIRDPALRL